MYDLSTALRDRISRNLAGFRRRAAAAEGDRPAAVALTIVAADDGAGADSAGGAAFLLTRRAAGMRTHARQWALPGGRIDDGELAPDTALRELHEELGLLVEPDAVLGVLDDYRTRSGYVMTPVVVWGGDAPTLTPNPAEVTDVYRVPLDDLDHPGSPRLIDITESDAPVVQLWVRGEWMHAPTAAVLYQFREVGLHGRATRVAHLEQPVWAWR